MPLQCLSRVPSQKLNSSLAVAPKCAGLASFQWLAEHVVYRKMNGEFVGATAAGEGYNTLADRELDFSARRSSEADARLYRRGPSLARRGHRQGHSVLIMRCRARAACRG